MELSSFFTSFLTGFIIGGILLLKEHTKESFFLTLGVWFLFLVLLFFCFVAVSLEKDTTQLIGLLFGSFTILAKTIFGKIIDVISFIKLLTSLGLGVFQTGERNGIITANSEPMSSSAEKHTKQMKRKTAEKNSTAGKRKQGITANSKKNRKRSKTPEPLKRSLAYFLDGRKTI